eukprot:scaffold656601_cov66-Prasinocladus_malaysianus.AAC.1
MDKPDIVELLLCVGGGGLDFGTTLSAMWDAMDMKTQKTVPSPRMQSLVAMAVKHRAPNVLEWALTDGPAAAISSYLASGNP